MMVNVAVAQMLSCENLEENLNQAESLIDQAHASGAELVLLPENFAMLDSKALIELAKQEDRGGEILNFLSDQAKKGIWVIAGSVPLLAESGDKVYASSLVFDADGNFVNRYDKVHLFDVDVADAHTSYRESDFIAHGSELVLSQTPLGKVGLSICYDLRFPEHFQKLRQLGAEVLTVPSAFTYVTGEAHWEVLLRARAIETQCYVLAANQGGRHSETRHSWGHSMIIDPWGTVLAECKTPGPGIIQANIDLNELIQRRAAMPVMEHRAKAGY